MKVLFLTGPAVSRKLISPVQDTKDDLYLNFRHLTLSPAEAELSSQLVVSATSVRNTTELR